MSPQRRPDWRQVFADFEALEYTMDMLSARTELDPTTLQRLAAGKVLNRFICDRVKATWCHVTGKPPQFLPMLEGARIDESGPAARPEREPEAVPAPSELDALTQAWRRVHR